MKWWERAKVRMGQLDISMAELSRKSGIDYNRLYKQLKGGVAHPQYDGLERLAKALEVSTDWLLVGDAVSKPPVDIDMLVEKEIKKNEFQLILNLIKRYEDEAAKAGQAEAQQWIASLYEAVKKAIPA